MPRQDQDKKFRCPKPTMSCNLDEAEIRDKLLLYINDKSNKRITYYLEKLKNEPQLCKRFSKANGLGLLIDLLKYKNTEVLNLSLSILGNSCRYAEARDQVRETRIIRNTLWILMNLADNHLHCRACRLIGNLAECTFLARKLCESGAVAVITELLRSEPDLGVAQAAIRATRNLWLNDESCREEIRNIGVIKIIAKLFAKLASKKSSKSKYIHLVETCLTALCAFLSDLNDVCALQMQGTKEHSVYRYIIKYCHTKNKFAMKCFYALCQIPECRPLLANNGGVECIIDLIKHNHMLPSELLVSLCLFCREAVNRAKIRDGCGLEVMLDLVKNLRNEKYHPMMLHALGLFLYDKGSVSIMVKHGILEVLTEKLRTMAYEAPVEESEIVLSIKRLRESSPNSSFGIKHARNPLGRFSLDYPRHDMSPTSSSSPQSGFPSIDCDPDDAEENYSSVCSDTEWADIDEVSLEGMESPQTCFFTAEDAEENGDTDTDTNSGSDKQLSTWTLNLLNTLSLSDVPIAKLADPDTIEPLVSYINISKHPKALQILIRIVKNRAYFEPLIIQGFVFKVDDVDGSDQYVRHFCELAETGGSIGQLAAILKRGSKTQQVTVAVSVPFLIKSKDTLRTLLHNHGGLSLIISVLADIRHDTHENAICSIRRLANKLSICAESFQSEALESERLTTLNNSHASDRETKVTFVLDDGTTVDACRRSLCQKSDVFTAMLEGNFSESGKRRVRLRNTTREGLVTLLMAVMGVNYQNRAIESMLDAMLLADKYLMGDIAAQLTERSIGNLNHENLSRAWNWARINLCSYDVRSCCVKKFLTKSMTRSESLRAFHDFSSDDHFLEFLNEVTAIVGKALGSR